MTHLDRNALPARTGLLALVFLAAQALPIAAQSVDEAKFRRDMADRLNRYAKEAFDEGFPREARIVWLMVIGEYDKDDEKARKALGYLRVGAGWQPNDQFKYPTSDNPDAVAAKRLADKWKSVARECGNQHKRLAQEFEKAGRTDRSRYHYEQVIRYTPDDKVAQKALSFQQFDGLSGTQLEQVLYDRSKKIERAVQEQKAKDYEVTLLPANERHPMLEKAGVTYAGVQSKHFRIFGNWDPDVLLEAGRNAERAIEVCKVAFEGAQGFNDDVDTWVRTLAFFDQKELYDTIVKANSEGISPEDLRFLIEHTGGTRLTSGEDTLYVGVALNPNNVDDAAVRNVARSYASLSSAALQEGIGHTFVGMFFGNNLGFIVDRREQLRTQASEEDIAKYSPNMDTWRELALEAAWKLGGTPAADLPTITADKFPDDARIKSWSFCDYLVRRDPNLLHRLDAMRDQKTPQDVAKKFAETNEGLTLDQLEKEWKDFWTGASPVMKAIKADTPPLSAVSKDAAEWLKAFNVARERFGGAPVTWSSGFSTRCKEHVDYLLKNGKERGAAAEQTQKVDLGGSVDASMFAEMALVSTTGKKPADVFESWLDKPGYRDALLNRLLQMVGIYSQGSVMVMDCVRGLSQPKSVSLTAYPFKEQKNIPHEVAVADLGPEVQALLTKHGHGDKKVLGYPISLHFGATGALPRDRESFRCNVSVRGTPIEGIVHVADGGSNRRTSAPGLVVFYPLEPLKRGNVIDVTWTFRQSATQLQKFDLSFTTK